MSKEDIQETLLLEFVKGLTDKTDPGFAILPLGLSAPGMEIVRNDAGHIVSKDVLLISTAYKLHSCVANI